MSVRIEVLADAKKFAALTNDWEALAEECTIPLDGMDATNGPFWFETLSMAFNQVKNARIVVGYEGDEIVGLLPLYAEASRHSCQRLVAPTELYGGRNGFLLKRADPDLLCAMLRGAREAFGSWQSLRTTLVDGSKSARLLQQVVQATGFSSFEGAGSASPYFPILGDQASFNAGISKGLRQTIRTAGNKLRPLGELSFVEFHELEASGRAIDSILAVERQSWKHEAGSAISCVPEQEAFYRALIPRGMANGCVYGQVLMLDGNPIAFNFGLIRSGVYSCLKHSNTNEHQSLSPAQVLNINLIDCLRARGVHVYDYMGKSEPHKLRWSNQTNTYIRRSVWIYNETTCGRFGYVANRVKRWALDQFGRTMKNDPAPETE